MKLQKRKLRIIIPLLVIFVGLCIYMNFWSQKSYCESSTYVPDETIERFMELVLEAQMEKDLSLVQEVVEEDAMSALSEIYPVPKLPFTVVALDSSEMKFNYHLTFDNGLYFRFWLEYKRWPGGCEHEEITDEEILSHFKILRVGYLHLPEEVVKRFMEMALEASKKDYNSLDDIANEESIVALNELLPSYKRLTGVSGLDFEDYNYRVGINRKQIADIWLEYDHLLQFDKAKQITDEELLNSLYLLSVGEPRP